MSLSVDDFGGVAGRHWHQLAVLLRRVPENAADLLRIPPVVPFPDQHILQTLAKSAVSAGLKQLLDKHLLSCLLLAPDDQQKQWARQVDELLPQWLRDLSPETAMSCSWIRLPLLIARPGEARVVWMLLGRRLERGVCRCVGKPGPDEQTGVQIRDALVHGDSERGYIYWFLQQDNEPAVRGDSLELAVALAARLLRKGQSWPPGLYASGTVESGGRIGRVGHLPEKYRAAGPGCHLFLAPAGGILQPGAGKKILACATLADAGFAIDQLTGGIPPEQVALHQACRHSPSQLLAHFHRLPLSILTDNSCRRLVDQAAADPVRFMKSLADALQRCSYDNERASLLAGLFVPEDIRNLMDHSSESPDFAFVLFDWCLARINFANHRGSVQESLAWNEVAVGIQSLLEPKDLARMVTHVLIAERCNRYDFRPDLPDVFRRALELEERLQEVSPQSSYLLGAMYGTVAQNFGFCGPDFLNDLFEAAAGAEKAFSRKYCRESRRMDNYRMYALLDAERFEQAAELLAGYLGLESGSGPDAWFFTACSLLTAPGGDRIFRAALVFRFLADTGFQTKADFEKSVLQQILGRSAHPWQLISLNLGRILARCGRHGAAEKLFRHGQEICRSGGETMKPMALLPLAELHAAGVAVDGDYDRTMATIRWLREESGLNRAHFIQLFDASGPEELLERIARQRAVLFPFSYR